jgi:hypothetical protein
VSPRGLAACDSTHLPDLNSCYPLFFASPKLKDLACESPEIPGNIPSRFPGDRRGFPLKSPGIPLLNSGTKARHRNRFARQGKLKNFPPHTHESGHGTCSPISRIPQWHTIALHSHSHDGTRSAPQASFVRCSQLFFEQAHQQLASDDKNIFAIRCSTRSEPPAVAGG